MNMQKPMVIGLAVYSAIYVNPQKPKKEPEFIERVIPMLNTLTPEPTLVLVAQVDTALTYDRPANLNQNTYWPKKDDWQTADLVETHIRYLIASLAQYGWTVAKTIVGLYHPNSPLYARNYAIHDLEVRLADLAPAIEFESNWHGDQLLRMARVTWFWTTNRNLIPEDRSIPTNLY